MLAVYFPVKLSSSFKLAIGGHNVELLIYYHSDLLKWKSTSNVFLRVFLTHSKSQLGFQFNRSWSNFQVKVACRLLRGGGCKNEQKQPALQQLG